MHSENGTGKNLDFRQSGSQRIAQMLAKDQRHARMLSSFQCHFTLQGLEDERYRAYLLSTNLIAINNKQDSVQNHDLPDTNYLTR